VDRAAAGIGGRQGAPGTQERCRAAPGRVLICCGSAQELREVGVNWGPSSPGAMSREPACPRPHRGFLAPMSGRSTRCRRPTTGAATGIGLPSATTSSRRWWRGARKPPTSRKVTLRVYRELHSDGQLLLHDPDCEVVVIDEGENGGSATSSNLLQTTGSARPVWSCRPEHRELRRTYPDH